MITLALVPPRFVRGALAVRRVHAPHRLSLADATPTDWAHVVEVLTPFTKDGRVTKLKRVVGERRAGLHLVLENVQDPYNAAAVLRTAEGLGLQHVHVVESAAAPSDSHPRRRSIDNVAMGAARWLTMRRYARTSDCIEALRAEGVRVLALDRPPDDGAAASEEDDEDAPADDRGPSRAAELQRAAAAAHAHAQPLRDIELADGEAVALVVGHERRGVSAQFAEAASGNFYLPMSGFSQTFAFSVTAAMAMHTALASGKFPSGTLSQEQQDELVGQWLLRDVKAARPILRQRGVELQEWKR